MKAKSTTNWQMEEQLHDFFVQGVTWKSFNITSIYQFKQTTLFELG
jgi:hypothetical protein